MDQASPPGPNNQPLAPSTPRRCAERMTHCPKQPPLLSPHQAPSGPPWHPPGPLRPLGFRGSRCAACFSQHSWCLRAVPQPEGEAQYTQLQGAGSSGGGELMATAPVSPAAAAAAGQRHMQRRQHRKQRRQQRSTLPTAQHATHSHIALGVCPAGRAAVRRGGCE